VYPLLVRHLGAPIADLVYALAMGIVLAAVVLCATPGGEAFRYASL